MKFVIYLFPVLINFVVSGVFFYVNQRFVDAGVSKLLTAMVVPTWAITYCVSSGVIGKVVNARNAAKLIICGGTIIAASSLGFIFLDALIWLLIWTGILGIGFGFYCSPFQVMCREMEKGSSSGVAMATGKYTCAWSLGFAAGAVTFGMFNYTMAFVLCFIVGVFVAVGVAVIDHKLKRMPAESNVIEVEAAPVELTNEAENGLPDYAWLGWIIGGIVSFAVNQLRSMLQSHGAELCLPNAKETMALTLMMVSVVQGVFALFLVKSRVWVYKSFPILLMGLVGALSMAGFCFANARGGFLLTAVFYGIYSGCGYFIFVFYALSNPVKAGRNAAFNEISVSIASISGPLLGGMLAQSTALSWSPFAMASGSIVLATIFHLVVFALDKRRKKALQEYKI